MRKGEYEISYTNTSRDELKRKLDMATKIFVENKKGNSRMGMKKIHLDHGMMNEDTIFQMMHNSKAAMKGHSNNRGCCCNNNCKKDGEGFR